VREDDGCLATVDLLPRRDLVDDEVTEVSDVAHSDVNLQIVDAADVKYGQHFRKREYVGL
jgi:hypothetical protein